MRCRATRTESPAYGCNAPVPRCSRSVVETLRRVEREADQQTEQRGNYHPGEGGQSAHPDQGGVNAGAVSGRRAYKLECRGTVISPPAAMHGSTARQIATADT